MNKFIVYKLFSDSEGYVWKSDYSKTIFGVSYNGMRDKFIKIKLDSKRSTYYSNYADEDSCFNYQMNDECINEHFLRRDKNV